MPTAATIRCTTCDTEFPANDSAELAAHSGHQLEHIDPGGTPTQ